MLRTLVAVNLQALRGTEEAPRIPAGWPLLSFSDTANTSYAATRGAGVGTASAAEPLILERGSFGTPSHCQNEDRWVKIEMRKVLVNRTEAVWV